MHKFGHIFLISFLVLSGFDANADGSVEAYELTYVEQEPGADPYQVKFLVTDRYLRIDHQGDQSGYIIYDDKQHLIHSVTHPDQSILVIKQYDYQAPDLSRLVDLEYYVIPDAPKIAGKAITSYRVTATGDAKEKCMDIKLAEGLLPEVADILTAYHKMLAGQQSRLLKTTPEEYRTSCFLYDQVFNKGDYYRKGLPIQEWHSNGKTRLLMSYKKVKVDAELFQVEESYQQYSLD
ncbi:hypothetical protein ACFL3P_05350 [Pseudomonadota bacterium]